MASNTTSNESELNFTRRVSNRLLEQGVEPRPIDPQCFALRDRSCPTGQVSSSSVRQPDKENNVVSTWTLVKTIMLLHICDIFFLFKLV